MTDLPDFEEFDAQRDAQNAPRDTADADAPSHAPGGLLAPAADEAGDRGVCLVAKYHPDVTPEEWTVDGVDGVDTLADFDGNESHAEAAGVTEVAFLSSLKNTGGDLWRRHCEDAGRITDLPAFNAEELGHWGLSVKFYSYPSARLEPATDEEIAHMAEKHGIDYDQMR